jgi:hypothetical protein
MAEGNVRRVSLFRPSPTTTDGISGSWFGQNQVGSRNANSWERVKPINSMVLDPVQWKVNSSCP